MITACTTYGIVDIERPKQGMSNLTASGFEHIALDLRMGCSETDLEYLWKKRKQGERSSRSSFAEEPARMAECFEGVLGQCRQKNVDISIIRAPGLFRDTKRTDLNEHLIKIMEESIRLCGKTGCRYLVVPPLFSGIEREELWKINRDCYLKLGRRAQENGVMLLFENQCRDYHGHLLRGVCADGREAAAWIDQLNEEIGTECFGFCLNASTCVICRQDIHEFTIAIGTRVKAVVMQDCDGRNEDALLPFTGGKGGFSQTDRMALIRGLREIDFDGQLVFDFSYTARAFSHLLRGQLLAFAKSVADFIKWQVEMEQTLKKYDKIVLFGAGNMCRNYMKCYGEEYHPLFTCDNNSNLWGTTFYGLEVKPPEALKDLPDGCAVFICNIYYREIEEQLRQLGFSGSIEFFSDEYLSSYYEDRLEMAPER